MSTRMSNDPSITRDREMPELKCRLVGGDGAAKWGDEIEVLVPLSDEGGGFNGSSQHLARPQVQEFQRLRIIREHKSKEKASCLGKSELQSQSIGPLETYCQIR